MRYLVTGKEMKKLDDITSEHFGMPPIVLMEQAASAFVEKMLGICQTPRNVLVVCGLGNNGGDGLAVARLLNQRAISTTVYFPQEPADGARMTDAFRTQHKIYRNYGFPVAGMIAASDLYDVVVDAIFGTGLSRTVTGAYCKAIETMNEMRGVRIAVDIASGISSDSGEALGCAFCADHTITFSYGKIGQYLWQGMKYSGKVHVVPIGITADSWLGKKPSFGALEESDLSLLPPRQRDSHKGTYGKLLVIAGSPGMAGAAVLAARAAYRTGTGLVKVATVEENRLVLQCEVPEAIFTPYSADLQKEHFVDELKWADAVVLGPGLGTSHTAGEILRLVLEHCSVPLVLDADALNLLTKEPQLLLQPHMDVIITPHLGEMARLTKDAVSYLKTRTIKAAREFAQQYDVICVLKDSHTVTAIPYGYSYINMTGNNGMATAGSGDVLSGVIGGLLAQGLEARTAAPLGVFLHGMAGDEAKKVTGEYGMMANDIVDGLVKIWTEVR